MPDKKDNVSYSINQYDKREINTFDSFQEILILSQFLILSYLNFQAKKADDKIASAKFSKTFNKTV